MRSDLAKLDGVSNVKTDTKKQKCEFHLAKHDWDLKEKLEELSQTNDHLEGFEILSQ